MKIAEHDVPWYKAVLIVLFCPFYAVGYWSYVVWTWILTGWEDAKED